MAKPKLITRQTRARMAAAHWRASYGPRWGRTKNADSREVYEALVALGPGPDPDDVDRVIGNCTWTRVPPCSGCERAGLPAVVQVGEDTAYDSDTAYLCGDCLRDALALLDDGAQ